MGKNTLSKTDNSIPKTVWGDTWKWLQNARWSWIITGIGGGVMGGVFVGNSLLERILAGFAGASIFLLLLFGVTFIVHLVITPSRLRREDRRKFIRENASYTSKIIGSMEKRKYLTY